MSTTPTDLKYAATHEWVRLEGDDTVWVGITDFAQDSLGDVVFVELPEVGAHTSARAEIAVVEYRVTTKANGPNFYVSTISPRNRRPSCAGRLTRDRLSRGVRRVFRRLCRG